MQPGAGRTEGNVLYYGDSLDVLRRHIADESVDLVHLDPRFNSNATCELSRVRLLAAPMDSGQQAPTAGASPGTILGGAPPG